MLNNQSEQPYYHLKWCKWTDRSVIQIVREGIAKQKYWSALATAPAETSAQAKEAFNFN